MGLFNLFRSKPISSETEKNIESVSSPEIPEKIFIENDSTKNVDKEHENLSINYNIDILYKFLDHNYESNGYDDALRNPDIKHMDQNIEALRNDLFRRIKRVKTFYEDFIKEIDFHIESRSRSGLLDTVDEMKMKKQIAESHINKVIQIEADAHASKGDGQGIIISYSRGFKNGLAAISHHNILSKRF